MRNHHRLILDLPDGKWSGATSANRNIQFSLGLAYRLMRDVDPDARFEEAALLIGEDAAFLMARSQEMRGYIQGLTGLDLTECDPVLLSYGLPPRLYGVRLRFNHAQPEGTADLICGNTIVTLEPII